MDIETVDFSKEGERALRKIEKGTDWPVVYLLHNDDTVYIGETCNAANRLSQHLINPDRGCMKKVEVIIDEEYNKSATLDVEQQLIQLYHSDKRFINIQNSSPGQSSAHEYYNRHMYKARVPELWAELYRRGLAGRTYGDIINSNLYKYSPYTSLNQEQLATYSAILHDIRSSIISGEERNFLVNGASGTGKTVLALNLLRTLSELTDYELNRLLLDPHEDIDALYNLIKTVKEKIPTQKLNVVYTAPLAPLRRTLSKVIKECKLTNVQVLSPQAIANHTGEKFDIIIVDEAHRLKRRKGLTNYSGFDDASRLLGLDPDDATQLDWIIRRSKYRILFYDSKQSVKPSDIEPQRFRELLGECFNVQLHTQMRCRGGEAYLDYVDNILNNRKPERELPGKEFEFRMFIDVQDMVNCIRS